MRESLKMMDLDMYKLLLVTKSGRHGIAFVFDTWSDVANMPFSIKQLKKKNF